MKRGNEMNFYLCEPNSDTVILDGQLDDVLENAETLKLSGHICVNYDSLDNNLNMKSNIKNLIGVMNGGRSYWLPFAGNQKGKC